MQTDYTFSESDKNKVVEFLNFIANRAHFPNWKTEDSITHFRLLSHMQQVILSKIEANILEMGKVVAIDPPKDVPAPTRKR